MGENSTERNREGSGNLGTGTQLLTEQRYESIRTTWRMNWSSFDERQQMLSA